MKLAPVPWWISERLIWIAICIHLYCTHVLVKHNVLFPTFFSVLICVILYPHSLSPSPTVALNKIPVCLSYTCLGLGDLFFILPNCLELDPLRATWSFACNNLWHNVLWKNMLLLSSSRLHIAYFFIWQIVPQIVPQIVACWA